VTIDAMSCQTAIAEQIVASGVDYCLAVKGNQPRLHAGIEDHFQSLAEADYRPPAAEVVLFPIDVCQQDDARRGVPNLCTLVHEIAARV
jgi:hypothetical protein